jgi:archaellin
VIGGGRGDWTCLDALLVLTLVIIVVTVAASVLVNR